MHPDISRIPSKLFYEGRLIDGPEMAAKTQQPWHASSLLGPYRFFNVAQGHHEAAHAGHSLINRAECDAALALYDLILRDFRQVDLNYRVGVISMYKAQITAMKNAFMARYGAERASTVDFNTVDGFQGQEKDVIILSCVRAGPAVQSIGFLSDVRRLNVSITRARSSLFILGHAATLQRSDDTWKYIVEDARSRSALIDVRGFLLANTRVANHQAGWAKYLHKCYHCTGRSRRHPGAYRSRDCADSIGQETVRCSRLFQLVATSIWSHDAAGACESSPGESCCRSTAHGQPQTWPGRDSTPVCGLGKTSTNERA